MLVFVSFMTFQKTNDQNSNIWMDIIYQKLNYQTKILIFRSQFALNFVCKFLAGKIIQFKLPLDILKFYAWASTTKAKIKGQYHF